MEGLSAKTSIFRVHRKIEKFLSEETPQNENFLWKNRKFLNETSTGVYNRALIVAKQIFCILKKMKALIP